MPQINRSLVREYFVVSGQGIWLLSNRLTERNGTAIGALFCHGHNGDASSVFNHPPSVELAYRGYLVAGIDAGGLQTWGNDTSLAAVTAAKTWLQGTAKAAAGKIIMLGGSMGSAVALNWVRANLASVYCCEVALPIPDVEAVRAANRGGLAASIETAYTDLAGWTAARPTHNPTEFASELTTLPIRLDYSDDDTIGSAAEAVDFAADAGATAVSYGAVGHTYAFDPTASVDWIEDNLQ